MDKNYRDAIIIHRTTKQLCDRKNLASVTIIKPGEIYIFFFFRNTTQGDLIDLNFAKKRNCDGGAKKFVQRRFVPPTPKAAQLRIIIIMLLFLLRLSVYIRLSIDRESSTVVVTYYCTFK